nr:alpha/beta hydrolases superfamily protein [Tanacetum cinerariifolium]
MSVKYLTYVNLTSSSEEQPNERTPSPPPRKKSLSPPSQSDNTVGSPHGFNIHGVVIFKNVKKGTEIVDVKNGLRSGLDKGSTSSELEVRVCIQGEKIVVVNKHGEKLVGLLHKNGSNEIVVLCHGFQSSKESNTITNLAYALEKERITLFHFDFAGNGLKGAY